MAHVGAFTLGEGKIKSKMQTNSQQIIQIVCHEFVKYAMQFYISKIGSGIFD